MKKLFAAILISLMSCKNSSSSTIYILDKNDIEITDSKELNLNNVVNGIDPIFKSQGLNIILDKTYSEHFEEDNHPNIWILNTDFDLSVIEKELSKTYVILGQANTGDGTKDKSLTYNFMLEFDSKQYSILFNTKVIRDKTYTIYFKSLFGESLKMRDGYFKFINELK